MRKPAVAPVFGGGWAEGLIGRERESALLEEWLVRHHLVTVTGQPGVGKSRLAAEAAAKAGGPWRRVVHVRWQDTGPGVPRALTSAIAEALTGRWPHHREADTETLARLLPDTGVLLFLDDIDPVHRECMGVVQRLLVAVPGLRVLVTARQVLGLGEEQVLHVPPLATSTRDSAPGRAPAVELFLDRARTLRKGFPTQRTTEEPYSSAELRSVEAICRSLEGVPHAIELAAEQVASKSLGELADMLETHQCWLSSDRPGLRRHRSLRDTVGASYALCTREARIVWGRASAFAGAFNESTAVFLCAGGGVDSRQVPSLLVQLAAVNVLEAERDPGELRQPRYRMTRAARDFGAERLREAGEDEIALERRVAHCRQIAAIAENLWTVGCQDQAVRLVQEEQAELTTVLRQSLCRPYHAATALETVVNLWFWWAVFDHGEEGRGYLLRLLPSCPADSDAGMRGRWLAAWLGAGCASQDSRALLGQAWPAAVMAGDDATVGHIAHVQGVIALHEGNARAAAQHFEEAARTVPGPGGSGPSPAVSLAAQAVAEASFAPDAARRTARRALTLPDLRDDSWAALVAHYAKAYVDLHQGRGGRARRRAQRVLSALDPALPEPRGGEALRRLITDSAPRTAAQQHPWRPAAGTRLPLDGAAPGEAAPGSACAGGEHCPAGCAQG